MKNKDHLKFKIVFCGTPDFALPSLAAIHELPFVELKYVVSMPNRASGRGKKTTPPPVVQYALKYGLPLIQTANINQDSMAIREFESASLDLIFVVAFSQFLGRKILTLPRLGCFNLHPSLLPKYRGAAPIQHAILNGETVTGISIQKMIQKMDAGDLCSQRKIPIPPGSTGGSLSDLLKKESTKDIKEFLLKGHRNLLSFTSQKETEVSFAPLLKKKDGLLFFREQTAQSVSRQVRAFDPWPGTYCFINGVRLKVLEVEENSKKLSPGEINTEEKYLLIGCFEGTLRLKKVQLEGKKVTSDFDFINGLKNKWGPLKLSDEKACV